MSSNRQLARSLVIVALLAGLGSSLLWLEHPIGVAHAVSPAPTFATGIEARPQAGASTLPDFAGIVERHGPAVVNISVAGRIKTSQPQIDTNDPFFEFFRRFGGIPGAPRGNVPSRATGSGFIVSSNGTVLTNAHVVADADEVVVKLTDKREFKAKVLGIDKATDVAVLKIDAADLPTVAIGNPQEARVGEWVAAIGSPFGFENSVTSGIISAKARTLPEEGYVPFLQTDVAINPGNSGGPLFNLKGEVIGINSQIYSRSGGYQGVSFAIPIDVAMKVEQQLLKHGKVQRGRLGIVIQELDQALANSFGLDTPAGALVNEVEKDSPAARAGIQPGDVIRRFNGKEILRSGELPPLVADIAPGGRASLEIWRNGASRSLPVTIGESLAATADGVDSTPTGETLGLAVRPLNNEEKLAAGLSGGLIVERVSDAAEAAGIQPGDIVLAVNGNGVSTPKELRERARQAGRKAALLVQRGDRKMFVPLNFG